MPAWHCNDCGADWMHNPKVCPCGSGVRPAYQYVKEPQDDSDARHTAFERFFLKWDTKRLGAELDRWPQQLESD